jgi:hypothetical protein
VRPRFFVSLGCVVIDEFDVTVIAEPSYSMLWNLSSLQKQQKKDPHKLYLILNHKKITSRNIDTCTFVYMKEKILTLSETI